MSRQVLITAGGAGIGLAMAQAFAAEGDQVWITDIDAHALDAAPADWHRSRCDSADDADMAVFLALDGARMVTGQALPVDGYTYNADS